MALTLIVLKGAATSIEIKALAKANGVIPVFGGTTPFTKYSLIAGNMNTTTGSLDFAGITTGGVTVKARHNRCQRQYFQRLRSGGRHNLLASYNFTAGYFQVKNITHQNIKLESVI